MQRTMTAEQAQAYARRWIAAWNDEDIEAVLSDFAEAAEFTSPRAATTVGGATVQGKAALRAYWQAAMAPVETLTFTLDHAAWDPAAAELAIVYTAAIDGQRTRTLELLRFGAGGQVVRGEVFHGAAVT